MVRDLSGGQRKRVSIAAELLAEPWIFFLDEPTSGLDPGLEKLMMDTLRQLADEGRTIVLVTHATSNITNNCDQVVFMARGGELAYFGPPGEVIDFFKVSNFPMFTLAWPRPSRQATTRRCRRKSSGV
jgi:ABC-type multidrug transport system ATPase subunit